MNFHDYQAIEKRLHETDVYTLIADCDAILAGETNEFIRLLRSALSLSVHVLEKDKSALAHQLAGRLYHHVDKNAAIKAFVDGIIPPKNSLYPIYNGYDPLLPAGGMLVRMMRHYPLIIGAIIIGAKELSNGNILSWNRDKTLQIWRPNGYLQNTLIGHEGHIIGVFTELKNDYILSLDNANVFWLWDNNGNPLKTFKRDDDISSVLEPLVDNYQIFITNLQPDKKYSEIYKIMKDNPQYQMLILSNENVLLWFKSPSRVDDKYTITLYDSDGSLLKVIDDDCILLYTVKEMSGGKFLTLSNKNLLRIWDTDGKLLQSIELPQFSLFGIFPLSNNQFLGYRMDGTLYLFDINGNQLKILQGHDSHISFVKELSNGYILTIGYDSLLVWDIHAHAIASTSPHIFNTRNIVIFNEDIILSRGAGSIVHLWDTKGLLLKKMTPFSHWTEQYLLLNDGYTLYGTYLIDLQFAPEKSRHRLTIQLPDNKVFVWFIYTPLRLYHGEEVISSLDEYYLGNRERIFEWLYEYHINPNDVYPEVEFPALGNWRVSYDMTTNLIIYDSQTGKTIHTFYGDAHFNTVKVVDDVVIAGDKAGRVIFLRWVE